MLFMWVNKVRLNELIMLMIMKCLRINIFTVLFVFLLLLLSSFVFS